MAGPAPGVCQDPGPHAAVHVCHKDLVILALRGVLVLMNLWVARIGHDDDLARCRPVAGGAVPWAGR